MRANLTSIDEKTKGRLPGVVNRAFASLRFIYGFAARAWIWFSDRLALWPQALYLRS